MPLLLFSFRRPGCRSVLTPQEKSSIELSMAMTCRDFVEVIIDYHAGELGADEEVRFVVHLLSCRECPRYLRSYEQTIRLSKRAFRHPDDAVSEEVPDELVRKILSARRHPKTV